MTKRALIISILLSLTVLAVAVHRGSLSLEKRGTDTPSEELVVREASSILAGKHSYGIVNYTHYPNGPTYLLLLPMKLKASPLKGFRVLPLWFSAIGIAVLFYGLIARVRSLPIVGVTFAACLSLLWQPSVVEWMGGLYGQSYHTAFIFAGMGLSLIPGMSPWALGALGFVSGWFQYDMTFCFVFSIFVCRWFGHSGATIPVWRQGLGAVVDSAVTCAGIFLAIAAHLLQNTLVLGGLRNAINDLIGSAAARAGLSVAEQLYPEYVKGLAQNGAIGRGTGMRLTRELHHSFVTETWSDVDLASYVFLAIMMLLVIGLARRWRSFSLVGAARFLTTVAVVGPAIIAAGVAWYFAMPNHTIFHYHFIQRHLLIPYCLAWVALQRICVALWDRPVAGSGAVTG